LIFIYKNFKNYIVSRQKVGIFFNRIGQYSKKKFETIMKVAIQGIKGAFHEEAAIRYFDTDNIEIVPNRTFDGLIESVENESSDIGIIAIENTISGTIHQNLNLVKNSKTKIYGEVFIAIRQNLAVLPGTKIEQITEVHSHYMAINQCRAFLNNYPNIRRVETEDTALSMMELEKNNTPHIATIGSSLAAKYYNLEIIAPEIETNKKNYTRFWIISKKAYTKKTSINKSSINIVLPNNQGSLAKILGLIASFEVDLTKIESVPIIGQPWNYMFFIDLIFNDIEVYKKMLKTIEPELILLSILGEYENNIQTYNQIHN